MSASRSRSHGWSPVAVSACLILGACTRGNTDTPTPSASATSLAARPESDPPPISPPARGEGTPKAAIDFTTGIDDCTLGHRGVLLDLADPTTRARSSGGKLTKPDIETREHEGASWAAIHGRGLDLSFFSPQESRAESGVIVEVRARGGAARAVAVSLNGKPVGTISLTKGETKIGSVHAPTAAIARGANDLALRFVGGGKTHDELAEIDWVRVGPYDGDAPFAAPTRGDAIATVVVGGASRRAISLRAPGFARCGGFLPRGAVLEGFVGATGGEAEAEVRVLVDRAEPRVIGSFHLGGPSDPTGWRPISLPLGDIGTLGAVELVAKSSTKGVRVAFAEARVVAPAPKVEAPAATAHAKSAIVVVLGSTPKKQISLYGGAIPMPELTSFANEGLVFETHRATSSIATAAMGSMLTGLLPRDHGASDIDAALAPNVFTLPEAARQAGIVTAMFTANPTTTAPFGIARGWETFSARLPGEDAPATAVFEDVTRWIDAHKNDRFFVVVHARGGHPPWDITSEELKELPPSGYVGSLEPKNAGEALAKARKSGGGRMFGDADRERAFALHAKSVSAHDAALGRLIAHVRALGREADTAWIVTSDVGIDAAVHVPFLEEDSVEEAGLAIPLVIRGPGLRIATPRAKVAAPTSSVDIARSVLLALGLQPPAQLRGEALGTIASAAPGSAMFDRPIAAQTTTRFSTRWAGFVLVGAKERETKLCNLALDPDCASDVRATHPLVAELLHGVVWDEIARGQHPGRTPRAPAEGPLAAALHAWGR